MWSVTHLVCLQGLALHVEVPDFGSQVVSGEQVATAVAELDVGHGGDDLREEGSGAGVLGLLKHWRGRQEHNDDGTCVSLSLLYRQRNLLDVSICRLLYVYDVYKRQHI